MLTKGLSNRGPLSNNPALVDFTTKRQRFLNVLHSVKATGRSAAVLLVDPSNLRG